MKYRGLYYFLGCVVFVCIFGLRWSYNPDLYYTMSGIMSQPPNKHVEDSVLPTTDTISFNLSAAQFKKITNISFTVKDSTNSSNNIVIPTLYNYTLSSAKCILVSSNTTVVSILGASVNGLQLAATVPSNTVLYIKVDGY